MSITITKHESGYTATITSRDGDIEWSSSVPVDKETLQTSLYEHGCHLIDIGDAFAAADPDIHQALNEATHQLFIERVGPQETARIEKEAEEHMRQSEEFHSRLGGDEQVYKDAQERSLREHFSPEGAERLRKQIKESDEQYRRRIQRSSDDD